MKYNNRFLFVVMCVAALLAVGCERDDICPENTQFTPTAQVQFFIYDQNDLPQEYEQHGVRFYGLNGKERLEEILMADGAKNISLPVNFEAGESRYLVVKDEGWSDTLALTYDPELEFISKACGFRFIFNGIKVRCTIEGPVQELIPVIEQPPANGQLFHSQQVTAKMFFKYE